MRKIDSWREVLRNLPPFTDHFNAVSPEEQIEIYEIVKKIDAHVNRELGVGFGGGELSTEIQAISSLKPDARIVYDVGGNHGLWSGMALEKWPNARVVCYEPQSIFREKISALAESSGGRMTFRPYALSDKPGTLTLYRDNPGSGLASLHKRDLSRFQIDFEGREEVEVKTLEAEMAALDIDHIDVLKIDVEGHELTVLKGLGEKLKKVDLVQFEFGGTMIDARVFLRDFYNLLEPAGFKKIWRIGPEGLVDAGPYQERLERFEISNYIAVR